MQRYNGQLLNQFQNTVTGISAAGAQVTVRLNPSGALATLYATNSTSGATLTNPLIADSKGYYGFYAPDGVYTLEVNLSGVPPLEIQLQDVASLQNQFDNALQNSGYIPIGTFSAGCTVSQANGVVSDGTSYWKWDGSLPKTVTAGSSPTPTGAGAWILVSDGAFRSSLANSNSTDLVGGKEARTLGNIVGNDGKRHFSLGCIPRCNSSGTFEFVSDSVHNPLNASSVTQPDQYTIRINYAKTATKINTFIAAPDAELAPYGVVCGGDVGTSFANIQAYAPLNFIADNNSPTPSITLNDLWSPSLAVSSIVATRLNASTLRVTHPVSAQLEPPVVSTVNSSSLFDYIVSYGSTQVDITCIGNAGGYVSYSGSAWSQAFSPNMTAPTLTWTASNTLKIDHGTAYGSAVVPKLTPHGGTYIPVVVNYGSTFIEVAFYDYAGVKATSQNSNMTFWYELSLKVPCNWPAGAIVSVQRGMVHVPSYNFKGVAGNNLWVYGDFEYA